MTDDVNKTIDNSYSPSQSHAVIKIVYEDNTLKCERGGGIK